MGMIVTDIFNYFKFEKNILYNMSNWKNIIRVCSIQLLEKKFFPASLTASKFFFIPQDLM